MLFENTSGTAAAQAAQQAAMRNAAAQRTMAAAAKAQQQAAAMQAANAQKSMAGQKTAAPNAAVVEAARQKQAVLVKQLMAVKSTPAAKAATKIQAPAALSPVQKAAIANVLQKQKVLIKQLAAVGKFTKAKQKKIQPASSLTATGVRKNIPTKPPHKTVQQQLAAKKMAAIELLKRQRAIAARKGRVGVAQQRPAGASAKPPVTGWGQKYKRPMQGGAFPQAGGPGRQRQAPPGYAGQPGRIYRRGMMPGQYGQQGTPGTGNGYVPQPQGGGGSAPQQGGHTCGCSGGNANNNGGVQSQQPSRWPFPPFSGNQPEPTQPPSQEPGNTTDNGNTAPDTASVNSCQHCGSKANGCGTLARFSFNSKKLKSHHRPQLQQMAVQILKGGINAVTVTGHTDSSGSEEYNDQLGEERAANAVVELRRQLNQLQPNAGREVYFKISSAGETQPAGDNAANNRRVEICLQRLPL